MLNTHINLTCIKLLLQKWSLEAQGIILICKVTHQTKYFQDWIHNFAIIVRPSLQVILCFIVGKVSLSFLPQ